MGTRTWRWTGTFLTLLFGTYLGVAALGQERQIEGTSVKPGINESWKSTDIAPLIDRLERDDREIFRERKNLAALVGPVQGSVIADVGAGSGFMSEELARLVGSEGRVIAVDINPTMLDNLVKRAGSKGLANIEQVLCPEDSVNLPPASVDLVFICDTYHHFEYPADTMKSIYEALKPGGQLVLVEFRREPGLSEAWILEHVRAGEDVFKHEIQAAGFTLMNAHYPPFLAENYVLRFRRVDRVN